MDHLKNIIYSTKDSLGNTLEIVLQKHDIYATRHEAFLLINGKKFGIGKYTTKVDTQNFIDYMNVLIKQPVCEPCEFVEEDIPEEQPLSACEA